MATTELGLLLANRVNRLNLHRPPLERHRKIHSRLRFEGLTIRLIIV